MKLIMNLKQMVLLVAAALVLLSAPAAQAFYNPHTGRWLSRDPIGELGGTSLYRFIYNNPFSFFDNRGLQPAPQLAPPSWTPVVINGGLGTGAGAPAGAAAGATAFEAAGAFTGALMLIPGAYFAWQYVNPPPASSFYLSPIGNPQNSPPSVVFVTPDGKPEKFPPYSVQWQVVPAAPFGNPIPIPTTPNLPAVLDSEMVEISKSDFVQAAGMSLDDVLDLTGPGKWVCRATVTSTHIQTLAQQYVHGFGSGPTMAAAHVAAVADAKSRVPQGCYKRHPHSKCVKVN